MILRHLHILFFLLTSLLLLCCDRQQSIPQGEEASVPQYKGTFIAVGDSLTAGLGVAESEAWPALLEKKLQENGFNWQVINAGISGETSSGTLSRIKWIMAQKPDIVILETGANDGLRGIPVPIIKGNLSKAVQMLQEKMLQWCLPACRSFKISARNIPLPLGASIRLLPESRNAYLSPFFFRGWQGSLH